MGPGPFRNPEAHIDNEGRKTTTSLKRKNYEVETEKESSQPSECLSASTFLKDSFGCVAWQPDEFPEGETEETQEQHHLWLVREAVKQPSLQDSPEVTKLMKLTYVSQRYSINKQVKENMPKVADTLTKWLFLREPRHHLDHFQVSMCLII